MKIERSKLLPLNMDKTDAGMVGTGNFATFFTVKIIGLSKGQLNELIKKGQ